MSPSLKLSAKIFFVCSPGLHKGTFKAHFKTRRAASLHYVVCSFFAVANFYSHKDVYADRPRMSNFPIPLLVSVYIEQSWIALSSFGRILMVCPGDDVVYFNLSLTFR